MGTGQPLPYRIFKAWPMVLAMLFLAACGQAEQKELNEALLKGEQVARVYTMIPQYAEAAAAVYSPSERASLATEAAALHDIATKTFNVQEMEAAVRSVIATVPPPPVPSSDFAAASAAFVQAMADIEREAAEDNPQDLSARIQSELAQHPDRAGLEAVAKAMALPDLAGNQVLVARRMVEAIALGRELDKEGLRSMTEAERRKIVDQLIITTRQEAPDAQIPPFESDVTAKGVREISVAALSRLDRKQMEILKQFYEHENGQKKIHLIITELEKKIDENSRNMISNYIDYVSK